MKLIKTAMLKNEPVNLLYDTEGYHIQFRDYLTPCEIVDNKLMLCDAMYGLAWNIETAVIDALENMADIDA